ncbi:hypothetical protein HDE_13342 [Halotydeus destructor]|nr:hypothetical protein HDE_13342 [Halotydeus destructor]
MRLRGYYGARKKRLILGTFLVSILYCIYLFSSQSNNVDGEHSPVHCYQSADVRSQQKLLLTKMKTALESLPVSFFLCYQSLWGALNAKGPLAWDDSLDICVQNEELSNFEEAYVIKALRSKGILASYSTSVGTYAIRDMYGTGSVTGTVYVFERDPITDFMRRIGWKHRILPPDSCESLHCFPPRIIEKPLPSVSFLDVQVTIPREQVELQKYLYPKTWWKDQTPEACK